MGNSSRCRRAQSHLGSRKNIEIRTGGAEKIIRLESVIAQEPVRLIKPVFPQKGRSCIQGGKIPILVQRNIGGEENSLQIILLVHGLGDLQKLVVVFPGCAYDHLGALSCRCKGAGIFFQQRSLFRKRIGRRSNARQS